MITGNLEMLQESSPATRKLPRERQLKLVEAAQNAAEHGAQLTQQLLAFARRSVLDAKPVDFNAVIAGFGDFLRRALGETINLDVAYAPGSVALPHRPGAVRGGAAQPRRQRA